MCDDLNEALPGAVVQGSGGGVTYHLIRICRMLPDWPARPNLIHSELSGAIIGSFFDVYNELGCGFLESLYSRALELVLRDRGLGVEREYPLTVRFRGQQIGFHRCDMIVNRTVIVEIKASEVLSPIAHSQLRNYLAASGLDLGLLLHFGPRAAFHRVLGPRKKSGSI